jgi:hypothetical protein
MKERIVLCLAAVLISLTAHSQTSEAPDGAAGVKFGMTPSEVKAILNKKGTLDRDYEIFKATVGNITYTDITVGTEKFDVCVAKFVNNKLYDIRFAILPEREGFVQGIYDNLQTIVNNKYKRGNSHRIFTGIYDDADGYEMQAVKLGKGTIQTFWDYSPVSAINLEIVPMGNMVGVSLQYQSMELFKEVEKALKSVNVDEF